MDSPRRLPPTPRRASLSPRKLAPQRPRQWTVPSDPDVHLTPRHAVTSVQRAWERKPRAGQNGKIVWKRPQRVMPQNQLRSKGVTGNAAGVLQDKSNIATPQKVVKKARLQIGGDSPTSTTAVAQPRKWDRHGNALHHKPTSSLNVDATDHKHADMALPTVAGNGEQDVRHEPETQPADVKPSPEAEETKENTATELVESMPDLGSLASTCQERADDDGKHEQDAKEVSPAAEDVELASAEETTHTEPSDVAAEDVQDEPSDLHPDGEAASLDTAPSPNKASEPDLSDSDEDIDNLPQDRSASPEDADDTVQVASPDGADETVQVVSPDGADETVQVASPTVTQDNFPTPGSTTSKVMLNDDETVLHAFLSRAKASKAARIAKRTSDAYRQDSDKVKRALASPGPAQEFAGEAESPSEGKGRGMDVDTDLTGETVASPTLTLDGPAFVEQTEPAPNQRRTRRSKRTHTAKSSSSTVARDQDDDAQDELSQASKPISFSIRRRGEDGERFALKDTKVQNISVTTRSNTRRNKGGALTVRDFLLRLREGNLTPQEAAAMYAEDGDLPDGLGPSTVKWDEELVRFFEEQGKSAGASTASNGDAKPKEAARPRAKRAKALGAMNGTPAKSASGKIFLFDEKLSAQAASETKLDSGEASDVRQTTGRGKRAHPTADATEADTTTAAGAMEAEEPPKKQARRLPTPARAARATPASAQEAVEKQPAGSTVRGTATSKTRSNAAAAAAAEESKQARTKSVQGPSLRSGLPTRKARAQK